MSEVKHSPSPWIFCGNHVDDANGITILKAFRRFEKMNPLDVRLASAAPELLEACKTAMRHGRVGGILPESPVGLILTAAIAKAEGETHAS